MNHSIFPFRHAWALRRLAQTRPHGHQVKPGEGHRPSSPVLPAVDPMIAAGVRRANANRFSGDTVPTDAPVEPERDNRRGLAA